MRPPRTFLRRLGHVLAAAAAIAVASLLLRCYVRPESVIELLGPSMLC